MEEAILDIREIITDLNLKTKEEHIRLIGDLNRITSELKDKLFKLTQNESNPSA